MQLDITKLIMVGLIRGKIFCSQSPYIEEEGTEEDEVVEGEEEEQEGLKKPHIKSDQL